MEAEEVLELWLVLPELEGREGGRAIQGVTQVSLSSQCGESVVHIMTQCDNNTQHNTQQYF